MQMRTRMRASHRLLKPAGLPAFILGTLLLGTLLLAGCQAEESPQVTATFDPASDSILPATPTPAPPTVTPTPDGLSGTISIWHSWDESRLPLLVQIIDAYRAQVPDVHFDVLYVPPEDLLSRYETTTREGWGPALLLGPGEWGPGLYRQDLAGTLSAGEDLLGRLNPAAVEALHDGEALTGLPYSLEGVVIYRNTDLAIQAPENIEHWATLAEGATEGEVMGAVLDMSFQYAGAHLNGLGGNLANPDGAPAFNTAEGDRWLETLGVLRELGPVEYGNDNDLSAFRNGLAAYIVDGTWNLGTIIETLGEEKVAIDPWPAAGDSGRLSGYVWADALYLNPQASEVDRTAARRFMDHFLSTEVQTLLADAGMIPASLDVVPEDRLVSAAMQALEGGTAYPAIPEIEVYPPEMNIAIRAYLAEGVGANEALLAAEEAILTKLAERGSEGDQGTLTPTP